MKHDNPTITMMMILKMSKSWHESFSSGHVINFTPVWIFLPQSRKDMSLFHYIFVCFDMYEWYWIVNNAALTWLSNQHCYLFTTCLDEILTMILRCFKNIGWFRMKTSAVLNIYYVKKSTVWVCICECVCMCVLIYCILLYVSKVSKRLVAKCFLSTAGPEQSNFLYSGNEHEVLFLAVMKLYPRI